MSNSFVLHLGVSGVLKADMGFRLYLDGEGPLADPGITFAETAVAGKYKVGGIPAVSEPHVYELTCAYNGIEYVQRWPSLDFAPPALIIPNRATGLAGSLALNLFKNGDPNGASLTVEEKVASGGDYKVTGFPDEAGAWSLSYQPLGIVGTVGWLVPEVAGSEPAAWIEADRQRIATILESWTETSIYHPRRRFDEPAYSTDPTAPTVWTSWDLSYDRAQYASFAAEGEHPLRRGRVRLTWWMQPGTGDWRVLELWTAALNLFGTADSDSMAFEPGLPFMLGEAERDQSWWLEGLDIPFQAFP